MKTIGPGRPRGSGWEFGQEVLSSFNTLIMPRWLGNLYSSSPYQRQKIIASYFAPVVFD